MKEKHITFLLMGCTVVLVDIFLVFGGHKQTPKKYYDIIQLSTRLVKGTKDMKEVIGWYIFIFQQLEREDKSMFKKKLAALTVLATMVTALGVPVSAQTYDDAIGGGEEVVLEDQGLVGSVVDAENSDNTNSLLRGITSGAVGSGNNKGYWIRGDKKINGVKNVYSSYKNYKKQGAASVTSGTGTYKDGGYKPADTMSTAYTKWTSSGTNKANYRYK